jgi:hypothetical protein
MRFHLEELGSARAAVEPQWRGHLDRIAVELDALRQALGGEEGLVRDDLGEAHRLSLAPWRDAPPGTRLVASCSYEHDVGPSRVYLHDVLARIVRQPGP